MRLPVRWFFLIATFGFAAGCGGRDASQMPSTDSVTYQNAGNGRSAEAATTTHFLYVANHGNNRTFEGDVSADLIKTLSGALKNVKGSPFPAGSRSDGIAIDPNGKFAYVANGSDNDVSGYTINASSGGLKELAGSPFEAGSSPAGVAIDPTGKFAYVVNDNSGNVSAYAINASSGALTQVQGSPFAAGTYPQNAAISPNGKFLVVTNYGPVDGSTSGSVSVYVINTSSGALTQVKGSPFTAGYRAAFVAVDPKGTFAYVTGCTSGACNGSGIVSAYAIDAKTGALKPLHGSPFASGFLPEGIAIVPNGKFAYVANECGAGSSCTSGNVSAYTISSSGALTQVKGSPFAAGYGAFAVAIDPNGKYAYVTLFCLTSSCGSDSDGGVSAYAINSSNGALKPVKGSPFAAGVWPEAIAIR